MRGIRLACLITMVVASGCKRHRERDTIRIDVGRDGSDLVFQFGLCSGEVRDARVTRLEIVKKDVLDPSKRQVCGVYSLKGQSLGSIWRYRERRPGVAVRGCEDLAPGIYIASANALEQENRFGFRYFTFADDGTFRQIESGCEQRQAEGKLQDILHGIIRE